MITQIATAIAQKFESDSNLRTILSGGLYWQHAPQDVVSPWGVFYFISCADEEFMGEGSDVNLCDIEIQVSLFSTATDGGDEISIIADTFTTVFDWASLRVDGYSVYKCQRTMLGPIEYIDEVWQCNISYTIGIEKE